MDNGKELYDSGSEDTATLLPHSCRQCNINLKIKNETTLRSFPKRTHIPMTIRQVRQASRDGCKFSEQLLTTYMQRSLSQLFRSQFLGRFADNEGVRDTLEYLFRCLSRKPFHILLDAKSRDPLTDPVHLFAYFDCGNRARGIRLNAYTYTGDPAASMLPSFDMEVDKPQTIADIAQWLSDCTCGSRLPEEGKKPFIPTRLIDLGDNASYDITVRSTAGLDAANYVGLSYCWGAPQDLVCTSEALKPYGYWTLPKDRIPLTFKETFQIARQLGYRYVWIDSMCIMQDQPGDVEEQILQMPKIFRNASLTLCTSTAKSCNSGFLQTRPDYSQFKVVLQFPNGEKGSAYLDSFLWWSPPCPEPLARRAWAYQERLLSPRILEYGWRTARWSCSCSNRYSGFRHLSTGSNPSQGSRKCHQARTFNIFSYLNPYNVRQVPLLGNDLFSTWCSIVKQYSALEVTFSGDRLAAIGGVAAELQRESGVRYLAGLWDHERLPSFLQWKVLNPPLRLRPRPAQSRAPSWSWACVDDPVAFQQSRKCLASFNVVEVSCLGGFAKSAHGTLRLKGQVRRGDWWCGDGQLVINDTDSGLQILTYNRLEMTIWPDCSDELLQIIDGRPMILAKELTLIAIGRAHVDNGLVRGLMLANEAPGSDTQMRVGFFQVREEADFDVSRWVTEVVSIA